MGIPTAPTHAPKTLLLGLGGPETDTYQHTGLNRKRYKEGVTL